MQEFLKADVFFFVTTIAVVAVTVGVVVALVYIIRILRDVKEFSQKAKKEGEMILSDVKTFREGVSNAPAAFSQMLSFVFGTIFKKTARKSSKKKEDDLA